MTDDQHRSNPSADTTISPIPALGGSSTRRDLIRQASAIGIGAAASVPVLATTAGASGIPGVANATRQDPAAGGIFRYVDASEPNSLDPPIGTGPFSHIIRAMFEPMLSLNEALEPVPNLATAWSTAEDQLTWTFTLKDGVTFHDGTPFDSAAVKYSLDRLLDPEFGAGRRAIFTVIEEVAVIDPLTVTLRTAHPFPDLHFLMADNSACIVSPTAATAAGYEEFGLRPVGTGPFSFVEWLPNDHITVQRFDAYHNGPATISQLILRVVPEASSREAMLRAGETDLIVSPPNESVSSLQENTELGVVVRETLSQVTSEMRQALPPFSIKEVRQAMNHALDREAIIETIMGGLGRIADSPAPPGVWGAVTFPPYEYNPERAVELLTAAGYPDGFEGHLFYVSGRWSGDDQVTQAMQSYWAQVGIKIEIEQIDTGALGAALGDDPNNRAGWTTQQIRSSTYLDYHLYRLYHSGSTLAEGAQRSAYVNPEVDALIDQGRSTFVEEERLAAYGEAQRLIWDDAPFVWVFIQSEVIAHRASVSGFAVQPNGDLFFNNAILPA